jgi:PIN domain nuclease of toxin-antitoxin system
MLVRKGRLALWSEVGAWIEKALALSGVVLVPIEPSIAIDSVNLPGEFHADSADRFIVATARYKNFPLITADRAVLEYGAMGYVQVIDPSR